MLDRGQAAEAALRRVRDQRWGPRTLDVDVIVYGDEVSGDPELTLPHPRAHERAFVLAPWHDLEPGRCRSPAMAGSPICSPRSGPTASAGSASPAAGGRHDPDPAVDLVAVAAVCASSRG